MVDIVLNKININHHCFNQCLAPNHSLNYNDPVHWSVYTFMATSSNGNIFRVTGPLWREITSHRRIHLTKWPWALMFYLIGAWINGWMIENNGDASDLRCHRGTHYAVTRWLWIGEMFVWWLAGIDSWQMSLIFPMYNEYCRGFRPWPHFDKMV